MNVDRRSIFSRMVLTGFANLSAHATAINNIQHSTDMILLFSFFFNSNQTKRKTINTRIWFLMNHIWMKSSYWLMYTWYLFWHTREWCTRVNMETKSKCFLVTLIIELSRLLCVLWAKDYENCCFNKIYLDLDNLGKLRL